MSECSVGAGAAQAVAAADREWADAAAAVAQRMGQLAGLLADNAAGGGPVAELHRLLATGGMSPSLAQFLAATLGEQILTTLANATYSVGDIPEPG